MRRTNEQSIGEIIKEFFDENTQLKQRILEIRIQRAWGEVLGPMVMQYTRNLYIRDHVLYVSLTSSVLRSELSILGERLVKSLNDYAGEPVINKVVIR